jgi:hypothetical protein
MPDINIENHGSIVLFLALSAQARDWMNMHLPPEVPVFGGAYAVEAGYAPAIAEGASSDGLVIAS